MAEKSKSGIALLAGIILVILLLGGGAYVFLKKPMNQPVVLPPAAEQTTDQAEPVEQAAEQNKTQEDILVETKKLEPAQEIQKVTETVSEDPAVQKMMGVRGIGDPNAPIKVVEYSSLTCGHCAHFHKDVLEQIKTNYIDTGKVYLSFKEFPLNQPALDASLILRCMPEDKFVSFMSLLFSEQDKWASSDDYLNILKQNAKLAGLGEKDIDGCLANEELKKQILSHMQAGQNQYKIQSTPSFAVNDGARVIVGAQPYEFFQKTFDELLEGQAPAPGEAPPAVTPQPPATAPDAAPLEAPPAE